MTKSNLCTYTNLTSNRSTGRGGNKVCKITPHYMCAHWTGRQCADYFASTSRQASSNYCIGYNGDIAMSVDENNRAWTSSSAWNDRQAITIECANASTTDSTISAATWDALVNLCADICMRYGITPSYDGTKNATFTEHRMFASTDCPGAYMHARMSKLVADVKAKMAGSYSGSTGSVTEHTGTGFGGTYSCTIGTLNIRSAANLSGSIVGTLSKGKTVKLDDWYVIADGWVWGRISGTKTYVAVGKPTGGAADDDYLKKVAAAASTTSSGVPAGTYKCLYNDTNVRKYPRLTGTISHVVNAGKTYILDGWSTTCDGWVWGRYTNDNNYWRYVAIRKTGGSNALWKKV